MVILRHLLACLALLCALLPSVSQAAFPATVTTPPGACTVAPCHEYRGNTALAWVSTPEAACRAFASYYGYVFSRIAGTAPAVYCYHKPNATGSESTFLLASRSASVIVPTYSCPSNAILSGSSCTCAASFVESGSSCVNPDAVKCSAATGGSDLFTGFSNPPSLGAAFCPSDGAASSCASTVTGAFAIVKNGVKVWTYEVGYSGGTCTPPAPTTEGVPTTCKGSPGTVNGVAVCIPVDDKNVVESIKQETTTAPVSAASAPGAAGSTTKSKLGICSGNSCSVTETTSTTTSPGGTPVVTVVKKDMPKDDYCKENPRSMSCKEYNLGDVAGQPIASKTVQLGITKAASFGPENAACPAPKTAVIMGVSLVMPYTLLCDFATMIRPLLIGFAYLSAALTFFGFARK